MPTLRELSTDLLSGKLPVDAAQPMAPPFIAEEVASRTTFVSSFANVTAFATDAGLVVVDTGSFVLAEPTRACLRKATSDPVSTAVWTHGQSTTASASSSTRRKRTRRST